MWSKFASALRSHTTKDEPSTSQSEVLSKIREQHPNLSHFHSSELGASQPNADPSGSPSVHSKKSMLKRLSKPVLKEDIERSPSPFKLPTPPPKKTKGLQNFNQQGNGSQPLLPYLSTEEAQPPQEIIRRSSFDLLRPTPEHPRQSFNSSRSSRDTRHRPSLDMLRSESPRPAQDSFGIKDQDLFQQDNLAGTPGFNSVRSILRDPKTPGTGQNVRFFSKDTYKTITPDQSLSVDLQNKPQPPLPTEQMAFLDRLKQASPADSSTPPSVKRSSHKLRPSVAEIFSPLIDATSSPMNLGIQSDMSPSTPITSTPELDNSNLFDVSQQLDLPEFPPPGLNFSVDAPIFENPSDIGLSLPDHEPPQAGSEDSHGNRKTSTPYKGKGKEKAAEEKVVKGGLDEVAIRAPAPTIVDEAVFHAKERSPEFPAPLHARSQSFSLGQTIFYSMEESNSGNRSNPESSAAYPSSDNILPPSSDVSNESPSPKPTPNSSSKARTRSLSDTVFQSMLRASANKPKEPEADINDESSSGLIVYSGAPSEPDPFSATANTYYTPQTMIPTTPPKGIPRHNRKTSKEENLIISLQTQLSLRTELCSQYETDLKARDELVEILGKRLSDMEKEDSKRKIALRAWKKKVQELEKACRMLEEEVEGSRQESMERSIMDEASGEALRMLHRQIASLEREKSEWSKKEQAFRDEVETLEVLVKDRSEDIMQLKESIWNRDESERDLQAGLREAKEQIDMMGNVSIGVMDEEEIKKLVMEHEQRTEEEKTRHYALEFTLQQEVQELKTKNENLQVEKSSWQEKLDQAYEQLKARDEEYNVLKTELEAQWDHTEKATEKIASLEKEVAELVEEREALKSENEALESKIGHMEVDWNDSENKKNELDVELQEVWNLKDALEKERDQLEDAVQQTQATAEQLANDVQERDDRVSELESEREFANESIARLEENLRQRDADVSQYTQLAVDRETEAEQLREEMSRLKREHSHALDEQTRALREAAGQEGQSKARLEELIRAKAEGDVEIKTSKDRLAHLTEEVSTLREQVHNLQTENSSKDIQLVQIAKQRAQDKEDLQGLNIALDSKQQELELLKRKLGVRGTAGSTPAPSRIGHRRDSSVFNATPSSRPPSVISDSGTDATHPPSVLNTKKEKKPSSEALSSAKPSALGKSVRANAFSPPTTRTPSRAGKDMGPPPPKARPSTADTPTPTTKPLFSRSSSTRPNPSMTPVSHRRAVSATLEQTKARLRAAKVPITSPTSSVSEQDEKENVDRSSSSVRSRNRIPILTSPTPM